MDPKSGRIYEVQDDEEARRRGLVPIPKTDESRVFGMNRKQRRAWASRQRKVKSSPTSACLPMNLAANSFMTAERLRRLMGGGVQKKSRAE